MAMDPYKLFDTGYYKSDRIMPAHKCRMCVTTMREVPDEKGSRHFQKVKDEWVNINGHEFRKNFMNDERNGIERKIELVHEKPEKFAFNVIYLLATRDVMWVWTLEPTED